MYNKVYKMKILYIFSFLTVNFIAAVFADYKKCYTESSVCLITNTDDPYVLSKFRLSRNSANVWCNGKSSSLATLANEAFQSALTEFINDSSAKLDSDIIMNAYRSEHAYNWEWTSGRKAAISPELDNYYPRYAYLKVTVERNVTLRASRPTAARNFICSYPPSRNSRCSDGHLQLGNNCYKIHSDKARTWFIARNLCLKEGRDLATFEDVDISSISGLPSYAEYWIGLRNETWIWIYGGSHVEIKYSNWDNVRPSRTSEDCLCLTVQTGRWKDCACSQKYRYICIQGYTPDSSDVSKSTTITPSIQATTIHTIHDSKFQMSSTSTQMSDDNSKRKADEKSTDSFNSTLLNANMLLAFGLGIAFLLILITVVAAVTFIKIRRSRSHDPQLSRDSPSTGMELTSAYVPTAVYAVIVPNASDLPRSPSEKTPTQVIYAELDLERKGTTNRKASRELEYANSMELDSVYANSAAQTREYRHDCGRAE